MSESLPVQALVARQRSFFNAGNTRSVAFRKEALNRLSRAIREREAQILEAVHADLGKSDFEAFTTEVVLVLGEIELMKRNLRKWSKTVSKNAGLFNFPAKERMIKDPHGVCLIMSPWNYPFQLTLMPLVGAIGAGNTAIVKPSAYSPATSALIARMIDEIFPSEYIAVVEGGRSVNQDLLEQHFDYIFFTGSVEVGKLVMQSASRNLTPVTLELGGKSPCIVDRSADIDLAAKRAVWGKCINSGQTCVAPDYFLVHRDVKDSFIEASKKWIVRFYGEKPETNPEFPHIVNRHHFTRLSTLITEAGASGRNAQLAWGGQTDEESMRIRPAIIDNADWNDPIMQEEIFGPIMPIISWDREDEIRERILSRPRPLALYIFSKDRAQIKRFTEGIPFGGGCVNDTIMHVATHQIPFGGTGASGMGGYHGKTSFDAFSRIKGIVDRSTLIDVPLRYAPFAGKYRRWRPFL